MDPSMLKSLTIDDSRKCEHDLEMKDCLKKGTAEKPLKADDEDVMEADEDATENDEDSTENDEDATDDDEDATDDDEDATDDDNTGCLPTWLPGGIQEREARLYSETSLNFLNNQDEGKKYELIQPGALCGAAISGGPIRHINFEAKAKDWPDAKVETFFAQVRIVNRGYDIICDCCVSLGPTEEVPHWRDADVRGCQYCAVAVHHPAGKCDGLIRGCREDDISWLFSDSDSDPDDF